MLWYIVLSHLVSRRPGFLIQFVVFVGTIGVIRLSPGGQRLRHHLCLRNSRLRYHL